MTFIERINSFINAVASDIKSLYANKVNKTDVISVAQGGTGANNAATARSNLGLGTNDNLQIVSIQAGLSSYKKNWRKLTVTLPSSAGEITKGVGVITVETLQAKVTNSDGIIIYNNDIDPANQFYVRVKGPLLVLGVTANSTKVFGKEVTIYVGEEVP